jgi:hypothetical protein
MSILLFCGNEFNTRRKEENGFHNIKIRFCNNVNKYLGCEYFRVDLEKIIVLPDLTHNILFFQYENFLVSKFYFYVSIRANVSHGDS